MSWIKWQRNTKNVLTSKSLHYPLLLTERTSIVLFDPELHAAIVEGMSALAPHHYALLLLSICLTSQTSIHDLYSAYGTGVTLYIPLPHSHSIPFLQGEGWAWRSLHLGRTLSRLIFFILILVFWSYSPSLWPCILLHFCHYLSPEWLVTFIADSSLSELCPLHGWGWGKDGAKAGRCDSGRPCIAA